MRNLLIVASAAAALSPSAAGAQSNVEGRVGRLESEMRAVQRKVFPNGQLLQPDIAAPQGAQTAAPGSPASSAVADLSARVTSLEQQIASVTGQIEQTGYRTRQLQEQFDAYKRATDARMKALEAAPTATAGGRDDESSAVPTRAPLKVPTAAKPAVVAASPGAASIDPAKPSRVPAGAVERPATGDAPEDAYLYGYRLWQAKQYPQAQAQLKKVVADYPRNRRASYAQNLLGRAYLDEGKPSLASMAFYDNYKKMPDGERAPESLLYLGQALVKLNKPADACKVYDELSDVYAAKLSTDMTARIATGRTAAKCK